MAIQTSVSTSPAKGFEGQEADTGYPSWRISATVSGSGDNTVEAGHIVLRGSANDVVQAVQDSADVSPATIAGVVMYDAGRDPGAFVTGDGVSVMRKGTMFVLASENVTHGVTASYGTETATLDQWGTTVSGSLVAVAGARWVETVSSGNIGRIEFNFD